MHEFIKMKFNSEKESNFPKVTPLLVTCLCWVFSCGIRASLVVAHETLAVARDPVP